MTTITREELIARLLGVRGATFATLRTVTDARANKTAAVEPAEPDPLLPARYAAVELLSRRPNPFPLPITKEATVNVLLNFHYDAAVVRRLTKEGKDESWFRRGEGWHRPVLTDDGKLTPLCMHKDNKDKLYVWYHPLLVSGNVVYRDAGHNLINADAVRPFLRDRTGEGANQGLTEPVLYRVVTLENVREIHMDGEQYIVPETSLT